MARQAAASGRNPDAALPVAIRVLMPGEWRAAASILAIGMRDNPLHVKAFGADPRRRQQRLGKFFCHLIKYVGSRGTLLGAFTHGKLVGVLGMIRPGCCQPAWMDALRFAGMIAASNPPVGVWRIHRWLATWARNDPSEPHWHIGPLVVLPPYRRRGLGRGLMMHCCQHLDALMASAWLETDLAINVAFYKTLGFVADRNESVLGVPNWFMHRRPVAREVAHAPKSD